MKSLLKEAKTIVLKVGSSLVTNEGRGVDAEAVARWAGQIARLAKRGHGLHTAQVLLTHADMADRQRYLNARSTLRTLLELGVIPVINENDTVVTDEIKLGDNDTLGAMVANLVEADALVILTDQAGLFDSDPRKNPSAKTVRQGRPGDPAPEAMRGGTAARARTC